MKPLPLKPAFSPTSVYWIAARDIYRTMRRLGAQNPLAIAALANGDMESAFKTTAVGDDGTAYNIWQHHWDPRGARILAGCKIDLRSERNVTKVTGALWWEMTNVDAYKVHFQAMQVATTCESASALFTQFIEGAGAPDALERRVQNASWWSVAVNRNADFFAVAA